jgi:hypothetical protein
LTEPSGLGFSARPAASYGKIVQGCTYTGGGTRHIHWEPGNGGPNSPANADVLCSS